MKKEIIKVMSIALALITEFTASTIGMVASAANNTTNYKSYDAPEDSGDYAYWSGSAVVKSGSTTKDEIRWMQAALNNCIANEGLKTSYLDVDGSFGPASKTATTAFQKAAGLTADGSFGPATIKKMKSVLGDNKKNSLVDSCSSTTGKITKAQIQKVLDDYGYVTGKYWTYKSGGSSTSSYVATTRQGRQYSYSYNGVECYGFANFVMHKVTGTTVNPNNGDKNGWKYIKASDVSDLRVGDIVRIGKSNSNGHSGVVMTVDSNGKCTFAQCFGGVNNKISIGTSLASSSFGSHTTLASMKNAGVLLYVYRYVG